MKGYVFFLVGAHSNSLCRLYRVENKLHNLTNGFTYAYSKLGGQALMLDIDGI